VTSKISGLITGQYADKTICGRSIRNLDNTLAVQFVDWSIFRLQVFLFNSAKTII